MSGNEHARPMIPALALSFAVALVGCADDAIDDDPSFPPNPAAKEAAPSRPTTRAPDPRHLDARIARIEAALDRHASRLEKLHASPKPAPTQPAATPQNSDLTRAIEDLRKTVATLQDRLASTPRTNGADANVLRPFVGPEPRKLRSRFTSTKQATRELMMLNYRQIMEQLGPPSGVSSGDGLRVTWRYPDGSVRFVDGLVSLVYVQEPQPNR